MTTENSTEAPVNVAEDEETKSTISATTQDETIRKLTLVDQDDVTASNSKATNDTLNTGNGRKGKKRKRQYHQQQHHNKANNNNKKWPKKFKRQQSQHNNKSDDNNDNTANIKKLGGRKNSYRCKSLRSIFKCMSNRNRCLSKFFLPDKRPHKDVIIPPTKFLLGGNISDPLNLNSLQDEALNASMNAATPKSSPITTPPKIDVIIPPNIYDPLHLMDPVDSVEYEKLLISPLKRRAVKHRHRKKKPRKRNDSNTAATASGGENSGGDNDVSTGTIDDDPIDSPVELNEKLDTDVNAKKETTDTQPAQIEQKIDREKAVRDLKLDLNVAEPIGGRKRKVSENQGSGKGKLRRMDSMDKIVSPVIPQPGAWKRPPQTLPMGAPRNRQRATSTTITEEAGTSQPTTSVGGDESDAKENIENAEEPKPSTSEAIIETVSNDENKIAKKAMETTKKPVFKKENAKYQYGNYSRYVGFNILDDFMDVRLIIFKRYFFLFKDKDVLDIGCNSGHMTIAVAKKLHPKSILGIDIDKNLISRARRAISMYVRIPNVAKRLETTIEADADDSEDNTDDEMRKAKERPEPIDTDKGKVNNQRGNRNRKVNKRGKQKVAYYPVSFPITYGGMPRLPPNACVNSEQPDHEEFANQSNREQYEFPKNVYFRTMNYVPNDEASLNADTQQYDLIMCLSTTKWIHLNFGDAGLKLAFKRMFNQLRPGGKLILEAQNWASYKKKKNLTETIYNNYQNIEFFPNKFHEYLLGSEVGFSHSYLLGIPRHLNKGFRRPIQLYVKGDFTPSQMRWSDSYHPQTPYEPYRGYYASATRRPYNNKRSSAWNAQENTPYANLNTALLTPSQGISSTSQYYNPLETDSYLPSYDNEVQNHHYCFASPLYSTVWSPPSSGGRRSASRTPLFGSIRRVNDTEEASTSRRHVYWPSAAATETGQESCRSVDETSRSPQMQHVYAPVSCRSSSVRDQEVIQDSNSPKEHVYAPTCDISSSPPQHYSGESSRSVDVESEENSNDCYEERKDMLEQ